MTFPNYVFTSYWSKIYRGFKNIHFFQKLIVQTKKVFTSYWSKIYRGFKNIHFFQKLIVQTKKVCQFRSNHANSFSELSEIPYLYIIYSIFKE
jgi:hypothetical protein